MTYTEIRNVLRKTLTTALEEAEGAEMQDVVETWQNDQQPDVFTQLLKLGISIPFKYDETMDSTEFIHLFRLRWAEKIDGAINRLENLRRALAE